MKVSSILSIVLGISFHTSSVVGFSTTPSSQSLTSLISTHQSEIATLKDIAFSISTDEAVAPKNDVFYLRYTLNDYDDEDDRIAALKSNIEWRAGDGNNIVTSARSAIQSAMEGDRFDNTPIQSAAPNGKLIFQYLDDKNPQIIHGHTPLHVAARMGHFEVCKLFIDNTENINPSDALGWTPLREAVEDGHFQVCKLHDLCNHTKGQC